MKQSLKSNAALQWRLSRMPLEQRHEIEADIEDSSINAKELERLASPLTLSDFPSLKEKNAFISQHGLSGFQDVLDATAKQREAKQREDMKERRR